MLRKKGLLVLLVVICVAFSAYTQELQQKGRYWVGKIEKTFKVQSGGSLEMDDIQGDIYIRVWDKGEVHILETKRMDIFSENEAKRAMEESESGYMKRGNNIIISGPAFDRSWINSYFEITLPKSFSCDIETQGGDLKIIGVQGRVDAGTGGGDVELEDIGGVTYVKTGGGDIDIERTTSSVTAKTGGGDVAVVDVEGSVKVATGGGDVIVENSTDFVEVTTGGGDVEIKSTRGSVEITTGGGDIDIRDASGDVAATTGGGDIDISKVDGDFKATTGGGDIDVSNVAGKLEVTTGGGEVELAGIKGAVNVLTGGGDVTVEMTLQDFSVDHRVSIKTGGGDIDLSIPAKMPATIKAEIKISRKSWEDYEIISDFPLKITTEDEGSRYRIIRAEGDVNGGGDLIDLATGGGNIYIQKLR